MRFGPVSDADLEHLRAADPTYEHIGSTLTDLAPAETRRIESSLLIGTGAAAFATCRRALRAWAPQRSLGMTVLPEGVVPDRGETVALGLGVGRVRLVVPNRIVAVIDESDHYGYAYGTLPGHPERGEELFLLERSREGDVLLTIRADSVPAGALRYVSPIVDMLQHAALGRYLIAVREAGRSSGGESESTGAP